MNACFNLRYTSEFIIQLICSVYYGSKSVLYLELKVLVSFQIWGCDKTMVA